MTRDAGWPRSEVWNFGIEPSCERGESHTEQQRERDYEGECGSGRAKDLKVGVVGSLRVGDSDGAEEQHVEERDRVCQVPTCDMSLGLEIDHIKPFAEGGATSLENLVRLCKRHHLQKTHDGYRLIKIEANKREIGVEKEARWDWRAPPDLRNTG